LPGEAGMFIGISGILFFKSIILLVWFRLAWRRFVPHSGRAAAILQHLVFLWGVGGTTKTEDCPLPADFE